MHNLATRLHKELMTELRDVYRQDTRGVSTREAEDEAWLRGTDMAVAA